MTILTRWVGLLFDLSSIVSTDFCCFADEKYKSPPDVSATKWHLALFSNVVCNVKK